MLTVTASHDVISSGSRHITNQQLTSNFLMLSTCMSECKSMQLYFVDFVVVVVVESNIRGETRDYLNLRRVWLSTHYFLTKLKDGVPQGHLQKSVVMYPIRHLPRQQKYKNLARYPERKHVIYSRRYLIAIQSKVLSWWVYTHKPRTTTCPPL